MSLVFLKNATNNGSDDHMKPYQWSNNFDTPLVLPPDSQVAYISSTMGREKTIILTDEDHLWFQIGNQQLNIPMPMYFTSPGATQETWDEVAARVKGNEYVGITDYMYDGQTGGYGATYNGATDQFQINVSQRLQPVVQDVWANTGGSLPASWSGLNQTGVFPSDPAVNPLGNVMILSELVAVNPPPAGNLWNCGWGQCDLGAGGKAVGDAIDFGEDNFSMCRSRTGIKRAVYDATTSGDLLGGALQFRGGNSGGAPAAEPTAQCIPYMCGLNSVQAIQVADAQVSGGDFLINTSINGGFGSTSSVLAPNVVQVRVTDAQEVVVEIMDTQPTQQDPANLNFGCWGNVDEALGVETGLLEVEKFKISTWLATALNQPQNTGAEASQPYNAVGFDRVSQIVFQIKWTTPYTFQVWAGTGFDEDTGKWEGTAGPTSNYGVGTAYADTYTIIYDSRTGGTFSNALAPEVEKTMVVPQYFGDLGMCIYQDRRNRVNWRGNFDVIKCYSDTPVAPYPTYDEMLRGINGINFSGITTTYPNIYHLQVYNFSNIYDALTSAQIDEFSPAVAPTLANNKGYNDALMKCVSGPLLGPAGNVANYQRWFPIPQSAIDVALTFAPAGTEPQVRTGVLIGLIKEGDDGETDAEFIVANDLRNQTYKPLATTKETDAVQSVHIQLTNLPINGRNGVTSTKTSTIGIVHNAKGSLNVGTTRIFETYQPEKNWIDLNNAAEMTLNQLRVYISDDSNRPATFLVGKSDVAVIFRQKPAADRGISTQPINKFGLTPAMGATTIKM